LKIAANKKTKFYFIKEEAFFKYTGFRGRKLVPNLSTRWLSLVAHEVWTLFSGWTEKILITLF